MLLRQFLTSRTTALRYTKDKRAIWRRDPQSHSGTRLGAALNERWQLNSQIVSDIRIGPSELQQVFSSVVCGFVRLEPLDKLRRCWMTLRRAVIPKTAPGSQYRRSCNRCHQNPHIFTPARREVG